LARPRDIEDDDLSLLMPARFLSPGVSPQGLLYAEIPEAKTPGELKIIMIENFPKLKPNEVVVVRATVEKGRVLDEYLRLAVDKDQKVYTVFDSIDKAIAYAESLVKENIEIECNIYAGETIFLKRLSIYEL
jgi:hypothetical protein